MKRLAIAALLAASSAVSGQTKDVTATLAADTDHRTWVVTNHSPSAGLVAFTVSWPGVWPDETGCDASETTAAHANWQTFDSYIWDFSPSIGNAFVSASYAGLSRETVDPGETFFFDELAFTSFNILYWYGLKHDPALTGRCIKIAAALYSDGTAEGDPALIKRIFATRASTLTEVEAAIAILRSADSPEKIYAYTREAEKGGAIPPMAEYPGRYFLADGALARFGNRTGSLTLVEFLDRRSLFLRDLSAYAVALKDSLSTETPATKTLAVINPEPILRDKGNSGSKDKTKADTEILTREGLE